MSVVLLDARSPSEFNHAHIPGAVNLPLLDDEHRKIVGTTYKQQGRDAAVQAGFDLVGPKFGELIRQAVALAPEKEVMVYCWRGGMRSAILAWVLGLAGFKVSVRKGGYKVFRNEVLAALKEPRKLIVVGGKTGSGKTEILHALAASGSQVIDLEALACHKGSSFGSLGQAPQPSNEQFENLLALQWMKLDARQPCWIENESRSIGRIKIPDEVFSLMRTAPVIDVQCSEASRINRILRDYGSFEIPLLAEATERLAKRLGGQHVKAALTALSEGKMEEWLKILLVYYDKTYQHGNDQRDSRSIHPLEWNDTEPINQFARRMIDHFNSIDSTNT